MSAGTRRKGLKIVKKRVDIPADLVFRFEKLPENFDKHRNEVIFGRWSHVMTELLRSYVLDKESILATRFAEQQKVA